MANDNKKPILIICTSHAELAIGQNPASSTGVTKALLEIIDG